METRWLDIRLLSVDHQDGDGCKWWATSLSDEYPVSRRNLTLGFIGQFEQCSGREKYGYTKLQIGFTLFNSDFSPNVDIVDYVIGFS